MNSLSKRIWKGFAIALIVSGMATWLYTGTISDNYLHTLPRVADNRSGRIYPRNIHGIVVFQTHAEERRLNATIFTGMAVMLLGFGIGTLVERRSKRPPAGKGSWTS
jgi:hypothetical protein